MLSQLATHPCPVYKEKLYCHQNTKVLQPAPFAQCKTYLQCSKMLSKCTLPPSPPYMAKLHRCLNTKAALLPALLYTVHHIRAEFHSVVATCSSSLPILHGSVTLLSAYKSTLPLPGKTTLHIPCGPLPLTSKYEKPPLWYYLNI